MKQWQRNAQKLDPDDEEAELELAFRYAVKRMNKDRNILPNTTLVYDIEVSWAVCLKSALILDLIWV